MRILFFSRDYSTHDHRFLSALAKTDHEVFYLKLERRGHVLEDRPLPQAIHQVHWEGGQAPARLVDGPRLWQSMRRVIRQVKPDLVHAGPIQTAAFLVSLAGFRPLVSMSWGYDLLKDAGRNPLWSWATRYTLRRSHLLIGDCNTIRQLGIRYGMPDERIVTFPWGVDLSRYSPDGKREPKDSFLLLSTRGWEPIYGVDIIARAFTRAASEVDRRGGPELRLIMLGNGSQAGLLRQIFIQAGVLDRVHFPGQVSQTDLPRFYRSADLYLSASHSDGSSISLLEAMASGLPSVVSDIPGNREWVTPGEQGWWFPDGDSGALSQAIVHAVEQRARLPEIGSAARQVAEQRADWEKNFQHLLKAYNRVWAGELSS